MIYAPQFAQCERCGGFWEGGAMPDRLCPVCVARLRAAALEPLAPLRLAHTLRRLGATLLYCAAGLAGVLLLWRH